MVLLAQLTLGTVKSSVTYGMVLPPRAVIAYPDQLLLRYVPFLTLKCGRWVATRWMPDASCIPPNVLTLPRGGAARGAADAGTEPTRAAASATAENAAALPFIVVPRLLGGGGDSGRA